MYKYINILKQDLLDKLKEYLRYMFLFTGFFSVDAWYSEMPELLLDAAVVVDVELRFSPALLVTVFVDDQWWRGTKVLAKEVDSDE